MRANPRGTGGSIRQTPRGHSTTPPSLWISAEPRGTEDREEAASKITRPQPNRRRKATAITAPNQDTTPGTVPKRRPPEPHKLHPPRTTGGRRMGEKEPSSTGPPKTIIQQGWIQP